MHRILLFAVNGSLRMPLSERSECFFSLPGDENPKFDKCFGKHLAEIEEVILSGMDWDGGDDGAAAHAFATSGWGLGRARRSSIGADSEEDQRRLPPSEAGQAGPAGVGWLRATASSPSSRQKSACIRILSFFAVRVFSPNFAISDDW